ncbi:MAG: hypothetical protein IT361_16215 [Gemmatimonadaceae bacterium]|nr:hypothetical protein [Gemmatimonadaceae bacterium]
MILWLLALVIGAAGAYIAYPKALAGARGERITMLLRAVGMTTAAALALNVILGTARAARPLVALDASASWLRGGDSSRYVASRSAALEATSDSVIAFGDSSRRATAATPSLDAASRLRPVVERAIASGRPLLVYTDGEIDDPDALAGLPAGSRVEVAPEARSRDAAVTEVLAPRVASDGDTVNVRVTVGAGSGGAGAGTLALTLDGRQVATATLDSLGAFGERAVTLRFVAPAARAGTAAGDRELRASFTSTGDADPRNDASATAVDVGSAAAAVLVSTAPDLDSRELAALLRGTAALPTRTYLRVAPGQWREDGTLASVSEDVVRRAIRNAPLVVLHGDTSLFGPPRDVTRGALALVAPPGGNTGEWFATGAPPSPMSAALTGTPWDSLPPLEVAASLPEAQFEVLETRRARRLDRRVAIVGWETPRRVLVSGASGYWRWRFRGGAGADAFTAVWGSALDWLAGERSDVRAAIPYAPSIRQGERVRWRRGAEADSVVRVVLTRRADSVVSSDTLALRFGATGIDAESAPLPVGTYDVQAAGGASLLVVNPSSELLPRRPTVRAGNYGTRAASGERPRARDLPILFALAIAAFCLEWIIRRRSGLR